MKIPDETSDTIILAGGFGTRLRPVLPDCQKVVASVSGRPFLAWVIESAICAGSQRIILALGYQAEQVMDEVAGLGLSREIQIVASIEDRPLGTGGAIRLALPHLTTATALVMNGDSFVPANFPALAAFHRRQVARVSMLLVPVPSVGRFGAVGLDDHGRVVRFTEKGGEGPGLINAGIYLMAREEIAGIPERTTYSLERDLFPTLCGTGLYGLRQDVPFIDIGTPESWRQAEAFFNELLVEDNRQSRTRRED